MEDFDEDIRGYENMVSKLTGQLPPTAAATAGGDYATTTAAGGATTTPDSCVDIDACSWLRRREDEEKTFLAALPPHTAPGLLHLTSLIRQRERSFAFLKGMWDDKQTVAASLGCSASQFTYGSSLFQLWRAATNHKVGERWRWKSLLCSSSSDPISPPPPVLSRPIMYCIGTGVG